MAKRDLPSPELIRQLFDYDPGTGVLTWKRRGIEHFPDERAWKIWNTRWAGAATGRVDSGGYLYLTLFGHTEIVHRIVFAWCTGRWPKRQIDHINGDKTDNRIANLRDVSTADNARNSSRSRSNTSGVTGVGWCKRDKRWWAAIKVNWRRINLGQYVHFTDAVAARLEAEQRYGFHENHGRVT